MELTADVYFLFREITVLHTLIQCMSPSAHISLINKWLSLGGLWGNAVNNANMANTPLSNWPINSLPIGLSDLCKQIKCIK